MNSAAAVLAPSVSHLGPRPVRPANVLLVDDQRAGLLALEALLADLGQNLVMARSGQEALRCVLRQDFAVILMDVRMPDMDGFEAAALIHQRKRCQHTPIIFLTAFETDDVQMFKGYSRGAVDYLRKPIVPEMLRSKVKVFVDIFQKSEDLKRQAEMLRQVEKRQHERRLAEAEERLRTECLRQEIRIARRIQQKMFPATPPLPAGFDMGGASFPATTTGGDYFDYIPMQDGCLGIVIGDVTGHGLGPALLMAETRAYLRAFTSERTDVGEIVRLVNRALVADVEDGRFATLMLARLDPKTRRFTYTSAGHICAYVLDPAGAVRARLRSTAVPLAIFPDSEFPTGPAMTLYPGECVVMLTDGVLEAVRGNGEQFGAERALRHISARRSLCAREIVDSLYRAVRAFSGTAAQADDITAIVIKIGD